jgi:hypothetical protein
VLLWGARWTLKLKPVEAAAETQTECWNWTARVLPLEKLKTPLQTHMRIPLTVMMTNETLLLQTRAALSLTLTIVVVAVVVAVADAEVQNAQVPLLLLWW